MALRAGPAGQLEVSSLPHSQQPGSGLVLPCSGGAPALSPSPSLYVLGTGLASYSSLVPS